MLRGDVPSPAAVSSGCRFRTRCPSAFEPCPDVDPALQPVGRAAGHLAACHLHGVVGTPVAREDVTPDRPTDEPVGRSAGGVSPPG